MRRGPGLLIVAALVGVTVLVGARPLSAGADVTTGSLGTPVVYGCSTSNPPSSGDTWYNSWADDDHIYATADDANGFAGSCSGSPPSFHGSQCFNGWGSNIVVNEIDGPDPEHLTSPFTNCMTSFDPAGFQGDTTNCPDKNTWKTDGTLHADCNTAGGSANTMTFTFTTPYVRWIGATNSNHGLALASIDGGPGFVVDTYSPQWGFQTVLLERTGLPDGQHTLSILPIGFKVGPSSGFCQDIDALATGG